LSGQGKVYAAPPARRPQAAPDSPDPAPVQRSPRSHYGNVTVSVQRFAQLALRKASTCLDSQNYHDFQPADSGSRIDKRYSSPEPGGVYIVSDHARKPIWFCDTSTLHRIDRER